MDGVLAGVGVLLYALIIEAWDLSDAMRGRRPATDAGGGPFPPGVLTALILVGVAIGWLVLT